MGTHFQRTDKTMKFVYIVWLRDLSVGVDDPDHEWPACFLVEAPDLVSAQLWGDHLGKRYATSHNHDMLKSSTEPLATSSLPGLEALPLVVAGEEATDEHIGW